MADLRGVLSAVLAQAGASVLPTYLCAAHFADGTLHPLIEPQLPPLNTLFIAGRTAVLSRRAVAAVYARLQEPGALLPE